MKRNLKALMQRRNKLQEEMDMALLKYENSSAMPLYKQDELYESYGSIRDELEDLENEILMQDEK